MTETVTLNQHQRARAQEVLDRLAKGEIEHPLDVLDAWESVENTLDYWDAQPETNTDYHREDRYIPVAQIAGTTHKDVTNPDKFVPRRLRKVLMWLIAGRFEVKHDNPPIVEKIHGRYYVTANGNHRVIAFKALGIERIYASVIYGPWS